MRWPSMGARVYQLEPDARERIIAGLTSTPLSRCGGLRALIGEFVRTKNAERFDEADEVNWRSLRLHSCRRSTCAQSFSLSVLPRSAAGIAAGAGAFGFNRDFSRVAFVSGTAQAFWELYVSETTGLANPTKLTSFGDQIRDWTVGNREVISWKSADGTLIEGVLHKPSDFQAGRKYPLFVIQHGEFDARVPIPNAYELYQGLQDVGVPVKLIVYKGFGHGLNKPKAQRAAMEHNWEWFEPYVFGAEGAQKRSRDAASATSAVLRWPAAFGTVFLFSRRSGPSFSRQMGGRS
jgi:hypothetical protein